MGAVGTRTFHLTLTSQADILKSANERVCVIIGFDSKTFLRLERLE